MLSISIRYGGKLSYAMRALGPMLGSNSSQTETALSQMLGHDGARRHTLLSKMLRHNSARTQDHSNTSIGLHQRSCAAVCDMFLGKNHGSHFITIKSIGKTHHPVPLRFAVNGSASARYASLPSTLATTRRRDNSARQSPSSRGGRAARQRPASHNGLARQRHAARDNRSRLPKPCSAGAATASAPAPAPVPAPAHAPPAPPPSHQRRHRHPKLRSTASPRAPRHRSGRPTWAEHRNNHLSFACADEGPRTKHL